MTAKVRRSLPFTSSLFAFDIQGRYTRVSKTSGTLYRSGNQSIWISPRGQLIFNLGKKQRFQGTLIAHLNNKMKKDAVNNLKAVEAKVHSFKSPAAMKRAAEEKQSSKKT